MIWALCPCTLGVARPLDIRVPRAVHVRRPRIALQVPRHAPRLPETLPKPPPFLSQPMAPVVRAFCLAATGGPAICRSAAMLRGLGSAASKRTDNPAELIIAIPPSTCIAAGYTNLQQLRSLQLARVALRFWCAYSTAELAVLEHEIGVSVALPMLCPI